MDIENIKRRLKNEAELKKFDAKLGNAEFVANAPADVVIKDKARAAELRGDVLAATLLPAFAHADTPYTGVSVVVVGDAMKPQGEARAAQLCEEMLRIARERKAAQSGNGKLAADDHRGQRARRQERPWAEDLRALYERLGSFRPARIDFAMDRLQDEPKINPM